MVVSSIVSPPLSLESAAAEAENKISSARNEFASLVQAGGPNLASRVSAQAANRQQDGVAFEQKAGRNELAANAANASRDSAKTKPRAESRSERTRQRAAEQREMDTRRADEARAKPRDGETRAETGAPENVVLSPLTMEVPVLPEVPVVLVTEGGDKDGEAILDMAVASGMGQALPDGDEAGSKGARLASLAMGRADNAAAKPDAALSVPLSLLSEDEEAFELPPMTDKASTQAQAQADALTRTLDPNAGAIRITVTDQKAPVLMSQPQSAATQTIAALAGLGQDADGESSEFAGQQQNNGGGNGQSNNAPFSNGNLSPAAQAAANGTVQSQLGVTAATGFTVPTMAEAAANGTGATPQPQTGALPGADVGLAKDTLSSLTTLGSDGVDKVGVPGNGSNFSDMVRGAARSEAPLQPYTQRPVVQSSADQVHVHIRRAFGAGADRITIQLRPAELGRIDVRIETAADGRVTAHVQADKLETLDMMARDARALEQALKDAGLQADRESLNFSLRGEERQQAEGNRDNEGRRSRGNAENANEDDTEAGALAVARTDGFAADGSLDIHV